jgi:hypothetical protein
MTTCLLANLAVFFIAAFPGGVMFPPSDLKINPSEGSSKNDFDFLIGHHQVHHRKLRTRLNNCTQWDEFEGTHEMRTLLDGMGNLETHYMQPADANPVEGMALRLFNPVTRLWSIYWADNQRATLDVPVIGSFENKIGHFFARDTFNGKPITIQFLWDATNPDRPVWSQAFSPDKGKTWEWNWYMYFRRDTPVDVNVIELRNYIIKPGARDKFIDYFQENFIQSQVTLGGYPLGEFRIKGDDDHFFWIRGFENMSTRSKFLPAFYRGPVWKRYGPFANKLLVNNDNVYLLRPLTWQNDTLVTGKPVSSNRLKTADGIAVVDFYIANSKLRQLIAYFSLFYLPTLKRVGIEDYTLWVAEPQENDFPTLPVFQDKNLLVVITFYKDEPDYRKKQELIDSALSDEVKAGMLDIVTTKNSLILYPANKRLLPQ